MKPNLNNPLIHIGYHKTATTWLQKMLFISENDIFEPFSKTRGGQSTLARYFIYDDEGYILSPFDDNKIRIHKEIEAIKSNTSRFDSKIAVISHERLSGNPHSSGFDSKKIASMLKEHFPESKIFIVIREQRSMILSLYFQYLTIGGTHNLTKYLRTKYDGRRPFFAPKNLEYLPLITEYYKLFGKDNVLVLPFEIFRKNPSQFIVFLGVESHKVVVLCCFQCLEKSYHPYIRNESPISGVKAYIYRCIFHVCSNKFVMSNEAQSFTTINLGKVDTTL